jgi:predicted nucleic acid-binding protein
VLFVDTSFLIALQISRDRHHPVALALWRDSSERLVTTNHVVGETWTGLRRRAGHSAAVAFYRAVTSEPRLAIVGVTAELERVAWLWLVQRAEREYSFVDATSFAFMRDKKITNALAFDGDFSAAGFVEQRLI